MIWPERSRVIAASPSATPAPRELPQPSLLNDASANIGISNLGRHEGLNTLSDEFRFNAAFTDKVRQLRELGYVGWRRVRGDGNCFYRAVAFGFLEQLVAASPSHRQHWAANFHGKLQKINAFEARADYAAHAELVSRFARLARGGSWEECNSAAGGPVDTLGALWQSFRDPKKTMDLALVRALRILAALYLRKHAFDEEAGGGITFDVVCSAQGYKGVYDYCEKVILPLGVEAEGIALTAVARSLQIGLRIAFLDRQASALTFSDDGLEAVAPGMQSSRPQIHVQLRPGHYDLLYIRTAAKGRMWPPPGSTIAPPTQPNPTSESRQSRPPTFGCEDSNAFAAATPAELDTLFAAAGGEANVLFGEEREALEQEAFGYVESPVSSLKSPSPTASLATCFDAVTLGRPSRFHFRTF